MDLQKKVWGYGEDEVYPVRLFANLERVGGGTLGAFTAAGRLVGFVASMPAWHGVHRHYHSVSMGVLPRFQNQGIGRALKWEQRRRALRAGIDCIEWTFDPTRTRNAFLNLHLLGAVVRQYLPDHYGPLRSRLQRGLASDRLICEWWLKSERVRRALRGLPPEPVRKRAHATVSIPPVLLGLTQLSGDELRGRRAARGAQLELRGELLKWLRQRYVITDFSLKTSAYLLQRNFLSQMP